MQSITREAFAQLVAESSARPKLRRELRFVPEEVIDWNSRDFLAVTTKAGNAGVISAPFAVQYVVPFQLQNRQPNQAGRIEAIICDICATWQRGSNSAVITFAKEKGSVSFLCCADLLCSLHVRDKTAASKLSRTQLRETISEEGRVERLHTRLAQILGSIV